MSRAFRGSKLLVALGLVALILFVYAPVRHYDFVEWDDPVYASKNAHVAHGLTWDAVRWAFTAEHAGYWLPMTWISYMVDVQFFGVNPGPLHVTNVILHLLNVLLLLGLLFRMTGAYWRSVFVAALFALHPLRVESVAWITERKDVLSALFGFLAIWCYLAFLRRRQSTPYVLMLLFFALALMAKPMLVTLPLMLLLLDLWPLQRATLGTGGSGESLWNRWLPLIREKLPLAALAVASGMVTFLAQRRSGAVPELGTLPWQLRLANVAVSYVAYLRDLLWPTRLAAFYPYSKSISVWLVVGCLLLVISASIALFRVARRFPYAGAGWLWYLGTLAPVVGFIQAGEQSRGDRFTYIPSIGILILIAWGLPDLLARWRSGRALPVAAGLAILVCTALSTAQVHSWENSLALWTHAISVNPNNARAHGLRGLALEEAKRYDEAIREYTEALRLRADSPEPHNGLGNIFAAQGKTAEAFAQYSEALRINSKYAPAHNNLANLLSRQGNAGQAIAEYEAALRADPNFADAHNGLGAALADQGKLNEAITHYSAALRSDPDSAAAHNNLGTALADQGKLDQAVREFLESLKIKPGADVHYNVGLILAKQGKLDEAVRHFQAALEIDPDNRNARQGLQQYGRPSAAK